MRTPRTDQAYTFQVVINNAREATKAIRAVGPAIPEHIHVSPDSVTVYVTAGDIVSAVQHAYVAANKAWRNIAGEPNPCV